MVADVLGLGFEVTHSTLAVAELAPGTKQKAVEMTTSHGFFIFSMIDARRSVPPYRVRTKKAAWLAATAGLVSARRGLVLTCKPSWLATA